MKITFLIRSLDYSGAERQLIAFAKGCTNATVPWWLPSTILVAH